MYKTKTSVWDAYGEFNIETAENPMAWPNENLVIMKKKYIRGATYTIMGVFLSSMRKTDGIDLNLIPSGQSYFHGFWYLNEPKTDAEIASVQKQNGVIFAL